MNTLQNSVRFGFIVAVIGVLFVVIAPKAFAEDGYGCDFCGDAGYTDYGYLDAGYTDYGYLDAGYTDYGYLDAGYTDYGYLNPGYTDYGYLDAGYTDYGYGRDTFSMDTFSYSYETPQGYFYQDTFSAS